MRTTLAVLPILLAACVHDPTPPPQAYPRAPPPPPPAVAAPPPVRRLMDERTALKIAADHARSRGLLVDRYRAKLDRDSRWRIDMKSSQGGDRARVLVDGYSGRVLEAKLKDAKRSDDWDADF